MGESCPCSKELQVLSQELVHRCKKLEAVLVLAQVVIPVFELKIRHVLAGILELIEHPSAVLNSDAEIGCTVRDQNGHVD